jgi:hypothetical protein
MTMQIKTTIAVGIFTVLIALELCNNGNKGNPTNPTPTAQTFGAFQVSLVADGAYTSVLGKMYDGPYPPNMIFEEIASSGCCGLYKRLFPFCNPDCGGQGACVKDDSCQPYPSAVDMGTVTMSGLMTNDGKTTFSMDPINNTYQFTSLVFPPCSEGDVVTLDAAGGSSVSAFTLSIKGISPLTLLNDTINMIDGQPINLRWTPPTVAGNSMIFVLIDVSYHGGTKAKIECNCDDNGSLTVPAALLDSLKTFGISGFPKLEISRRATSADTSAKAKIVLESKVVKILYIPGIINCNSDSGCPAGQTCAADQRCR